MLSWEQFVRPHTRATLCLCVRERHSERGGRTEEKNRKGSNICEVRLYKGFGTDVGIRLCCHLVLYTQATEVCVEVIVALRLCCLC